MDLRVETATHPYGNTAMTRAWRRPCRSAGARGQVLVIFALVSVVLFVTVGLAVDAGFAYLRSDAEERAAGAAAVSGVTYLPGDMASATAFALQEAARNGFNPLLNPSVTVAVTQPANTQTQLTVTISDRVPVSFLRLFGFRNTAVTRSETADYMPPLLLGQPGPALGSALPQLNTPGNYYFLREQGVGSFRSQGDAYSPDPTYDSAYAAVPPDIHALSKLRNTEDSYGGLPDDGGYNYLLYVPPGQLADLQVYNPGFAASRDGYHEADDIPPGGTHTGAGSWTDPSWYSGIKYTFFKSASPQTHRGETVLGQALYRPIDGHTTCRRTTCNGYEYFDPANGNYLTQAVGTPAAYHSWISVGSFAPGGPDGQLVNLLTALPSGGALDGGVAGQYYRLRVDNVNWDGTIVSNPDNASSGKHAYALRLNIFGTPTLCAVCNVATLSDMCFFTPIQRGTFQLPFVNVPSEYAGRTFTVNLFDAGDVHQGRADISVIQPPYQGHPTTDTATAGAIYNTGSQLGGPVAAWTAVAPNTPGKADVMVEDPSGNQLFEGHWLQFQIMVPPDYKQLGSQPYWQLQYAIPSGTATDTLTVSVKSTAYPVHLIP